MREQKEYEVIKFIEHNGQYRIVMDCVRGRLLVDRVRDPQGITRVQVFHWFEKAAEEIEKYENSKNGRCYHYLNPYSVLITPEEDLFLLDLTSEDNHEIQKNIQKPEMRVHFIKPLQYIDRQRAAAVDLYVLGKTIQFILAYTSEFYTLTRREEYLLSDLIAKCLEVNPKKKYDTVSQVRRDLRKITDVKMQKQKKKMAVIILAVVTILLGVCSVKSFAQETAPDAVCCQQEYR